MLARCVPYQAPLPTRGMENRDRYRGWHAVCLIKPPPHSLQGLARCVPYQAPLPTRYRGWHAVCLIKPPSPLTADMSNPHGTDGVITLLKHLCTWCVVSPELGCFMQKVINADLDSIQLLVQRCVLMKAPELCIWRWGVLPESIFGLMTLCR